MEYGNPREIDEELVDLTNARDPAVNCLFDDLYADLDDLTDTVVNAIRREAPSYQVFPYDRHRADGALGIRMIVSGLRDRAAPTEEAARHAAEMGRDRARFGIPLIDAIEGYHVVYRELWNSVLSRAIREGPEVTAALSREVGLLWVWVHRASSAFASAHAHETARARVSLQETRTRLVSLLTAEIVGQRTIESLADALGFRPSENFVVVCAASATPSDADAINDRFADRAGVVHCALDTDERAVAIVQGVDARTVADVVQVVTESVVGVGASGVGVAGAARSVRDAVTALAAATRLRPIVEFDHDWPGAVLLATSDGFHHVVAGGVQVAQDNPHLADAVVAFAESRFSVTSAASALQIHANTAKYRIDRWCRLTGWDLFTPDGLAASLVAVRSGGRGAASAER